MDLGSWMNMYNFGPSQTRDGELYFNNLSTNTTFPLDEEIESFGKNERECSYLRFSFHNDRILPSNGRAGGPSIRHDNAYRWRRVHRKDSQAIVNKTIGIHIVHNREKCNSFNTIDDDDLKWRRLNIPDLFEVEPTRRWDDESCNDRLNCFELFAIHSELDATDYQMWEKLGQCNEANCIDSIASNQ